MFFKSKDQKLDMGRVNEVIKLTHHLLKILFILATISLIILITNLIKSWNILPIIGTILGVIAPVFIGLVVAWLFDPIVTYLQKKKIKRVFGTIIVYLVIIGFIYLIIRLMIPTLADQVNDFVSSIPSILNDIKDFISNIFTKISNISNYDLTSIKDQIFQFIEDLGVSLAVNLPQTLMNGIRAFFSGGITLVLGFMFGFYLLIDFKNVSKHLLEIIPGKWHEDSVTLCSKLNKTLRDFVQGTLFIMLIVFFVQSIGFTLIGLKAPLLFGIFCAITNVIPYIGPYIGGAPAVIVGFSISPLTGICTLVCVVVVQLIESSILQPIVMGKTMKLHPVTIMIGLLIFQYIFGILGMIIATPVIASFKVIFQFIDSKMHFMKMIHQEKELKETSIN